MSDKILQGVAKCTDLLHNLEAKTLETYEKGPFTMHGLVRKHSWQMATASLRDHKEISQVAVRTRRNRRTLVALTTHAGKDVRRIAQTIGSMKEALARKRYFIARKADGTPHYYYVHEKGTTAGTASHKTRVARLTYNAQEKHFEIEAYAEHAEGIIKTLFNGRRRPTPSAQLSLFDAPAAKD